MVLAAGEDLAAFDHIRTVSRLILPPGQKTAILWAVLARMPAHKTRPRKEERGFFYAPKFLCTEVLRRSFASASCGRAQLPQAAQFLAIESRRVSESKPGACSDFPADASGFYFSLA
jgi:hypothetical protein